MKNIRMITQFKKKGITNPFLLKALQDIPETFLSAKVPLPFTDQANNAQVAYEKIEPRVVTVAKMIEHFSIDRADKILVMGVDSVYMLTALSKIYKEVAVIATDHMDVKWINKSLKSFGVNNVSVKVDHQMKGWKEKAPFDAILIASEYEEVSLPLKEQLKIGGKLLIPIGPDWAHLIIEMIHRVSETEYKVEKLRDDFLAPSANILPEIGSRDFPDHEIVKELKAKAISFGSLQDYPIDGLLDRIGDAQVVLLGEASHGTSEFYLCRQEISKALIEKRGFNFICAEADWSDAEQINNYIQNKPSQTDWLPFTRFPQWMWKNKEVLDFVEWQKGYNAQHKNRSGFYGLDLYGLENSINLVIEYLEKADSRLADLAKARYGCITPFMEDPAIYGKMVLSKQLRSCENEILKMLIDLLKNKHTLNHSPEYFYAYQNANVVVDAERYYKAMYYGSAESWNLRDFHMFHTLKSLLTYYGPDAKAIVWAHNSHIGNALSTEMYAQGEINLGHLCKEYFRDKAYNIGFGTHTGSVAAAHNWGEKMHVMTVQPSLPGSYENLCHQTQLASFTLPLRKDAARKKLREVLNTPKIERAIGVMYRPKTERISHYFRAVLPSQFDEYIWFDESRAVTPVTSKKMDPALLVGHPFGFIDQ